MNRLAGLCLFLLAACQSPSSLLAPSGHLKVGLYAGTPTSVLLGAEPKGVGYELGRELARALNVPFEPVIFSKNAEVLNALKTGDIDIAFTNASPERIREFAFSAPCLLSEQGYLAGPDAALQSIDDVDRAGMRVGVTEHSTTDGVLSASLKSARIVRARTLEDGLRLLASKEIDLYATNKATLFDLAAKLPGSRVLAGKWGTEQFAIALPKNKADGLSFVNAFVRRAKQSGILGAAIEHAGLRGATVAN